MLIEKPPDGVDVSTMCRKSNVLRHGHSDKCGSRVSAMSIVASPHATNASSSNPESNLKIYNQWISSLAIREILTAIRPNAEDVLVPS